jgi:osmoprotectant transport system permease protein
VRLIGGLWIDTEAALAQSREPISGLSPVPSNTLTALPSLARLLPRNQVLPTLVLIAALAACGAGFVTLAPNRLISGAPIALWRVDVAPASGVLAASGILLLVLGFAAPRRFVHFGAATISAAALAAALIAAGLAAATLAAGAPPGFAISLGGGFWVILGCAALALIDALQRAEANAPVQLAAAALAAIGFAVMAKTGLFDALSLAREYATRREVFAAAFVRHIALVVGALLPALLIGAPLGLLALRRKRFEAPLFAALNLLQTVPSIALFGLLIGPLSGLASAVPALGALGIGGVGLAPAIIALVLYALLPIARNTHAGVGSVSPAAIDAARGMGMSPRQVFWQVEAPLALPVLLAGLRIVMVQTIGLAVVAALIGAGGLGSFVFDGLGQYATDLVLLGALPAIAMALGADFLLRLAASALRRRFAP